MEAEPERTRQADFFSRTSTVVVMLISLAVKIAESCSSFTDFFQHKCLWTRVHLLRNGFVSLQSAVISSSFPPDIKEAEWKLLCPQTALKALVLSCCGQMKGSLVSFSSQLLCPDGQIFLMWFLQNRGGSEKQ